MVGATALMKQTDPRDIIAVLFQANLPVLVWGDPGTGKTKFVQQLVRLLGIKPENFVTLVGSMYEPQDIGGYPAPDHTDKVVDYMPGRWVKALGEVLSALFLDEINTSGPAMQAAMLRLIHERVVGDHRIAARILAAANPVETSAGGMEVGLALRNRFAHVWWDINGAWWLPAKRSGWAYKPPLVKRGWREGIALVDEQVTNFLEFRPALRQASAENEVASASARSWDFAARAVAASRAAGLSADTTLAMLHGIVGEAPATEFGAFVVLDDSGKVTVKELLHDPDKACKQLRDEGPDVRNAVFTALTNMKQGGGVADDGVERVYKAAIAAKLDLGELQGHWARVSFACDPQVRARVATAITEAQVDQAGGAKARGSILNQVRGS